MLRARDYDASPMSHRLIVTGPVSNLERYAEACSSAGWIPALFPLLEVFPRRLQPWREPARRPDWLCVTSKNALAALELEGARFRGIPCATVGASAASQLRDRGFQVVIDGVNSAKELAQRLIDELSLPCLVLWPRSSQAHELATLLRDSGIEVWDPIAYNTIERGGAEHMPDADAVFLASPSAVRAHYKRICNGEPMTNYAITIGPTTADCLKRSHASDFIRTFKLPEPSPAALKDILMEIREKGHFA
jgi:uroporphyrinogen-III synthase